ncbi:MAG TPA: beta-N-acetylhexosaminidase [Candidatus Binatia bacterium]|nr:beta-N-acetylhexosaminidase [Candidatus Binatia bacterium]
MTARLARLPQKLAPTVLGLLLVGSAAISSCSSQPTPNTSEATSMPVPMSDVIPAPVSATPDPAANFMLSSQTVIEAAGGSATQTTARWLAALLRQGTSYPFPLVAPGSHADQVIALKLGAADPSLGDEGYTLTVGTSQVVIEANAGAGLFHGAETLRQLLPARIEKAGSPGPWVVSGGRIVDYPRYPYRGAMLDVARHFFGVADVERYIDELALYKINYLHLHLSDDQGWRIAISAWPQLTSVGGSTEVGGGPGGYYTQAQYQQIGAYAASRYITIVPEIDTPGHVDAALASYPELNCDGQARPLYTGIDVGFSSLCVDKPVTYQFLDGVISELAALTPGPYIGIGGDEAQSTSPADYASFIEKVTQIVEAHGKIPVGWAETAAANLPPDCVVEYWDTADSGASADQAAARGVKVVLAPANRAYLDQKYDPSTTLGLVWAGPTSVQTSYDWQPTDYGVPTGLIEGVEAPLWSETLTTMGDIEFMAFPRLPGIAEIGWSPASTHDWASYRERLAAQAPRWEVTGLSFYRAPEVPWPAR